MHAGALLVKNQNPHEQGAWDPKELDMTEQPNNTMTEVFPAALLIMVDGERPLSTVSAIGSWV